MSSAGGDPSWQAMVSVRTSIVPPGPCPPPADTPDTSAVVTTPQVTASLHDFAVSLLFYPDGIPMRVSDVLPGNVHDLAAARENVLAVLRPFLEAMPVLADPGYEGAGHGVHVPVKKPAGVKEPGIDTRARNALLRSVRCLGERGFALLTQR